MKRSFRSICNAARFHSAAVIRPATRRSAASIHSVLRPVSSIHGATLAVVLVAGFAAVALTACTAASDPTPDAAADVADDLNAADRPATVVSNATAEPVAPRAEPISPTEEPPAPAAAATAEVTPRSPGEAKLSLTETHTSTAWGYAFDFPTGWHVDESETIAILRSEHDPTQPGTDGVPPTITKIDVVVLEGFPLDLEARAAQIRDELATITEDEPLTLQSGEPAIWLRGSASMTEDTGIVLTIVRGQLLQLQAYGNPNPLRAIGFTMREASVE